nr:hypothetical protein CFP56_53432 [Quercus suber]
MVITNQEVEDDVVTSMNHVTIVEDTKEEPPIEENVEDSPPIFEEGIQATVDELKEINNSTGSKAPGWGEQWSVEGYGGNDDDDKLMNKVGNSSGSKMGDVKAAASAGLGKLHHLLSPADAAAFTSPILLPLLFPTLFMSLSSSSLPP